MPAIDETKTIVPEEEDEEMEEFEKDDLALAKRLQHCIHALSKEEKENQSSEGEDMHNVIDEPNWTEYDVKLLDNSKDTTGLFDTVADLTKANIERATDDGRRTITMSLKTLRRWVEATEELAVARYIRQADLGASASPWARREALKEEAKTSKSSNKLETVKDERKSSNSLRRSETLKDGGKPKKAKKEA